MIPKIIHYCWFGKSEKPQLVKKCIKSWLSLHPGWELREWDEDKSPIDLPYVKNALDAKRFAFASDYVRFYALYKFGGVYLDTDIEVIKSFDPLRDNNFFLGRESSKYINPAVIGSIAGHPFTKRILTILDDSISKGYTAIPEILTSALERNPDCSSDVVVYDTDYFFPYNPFDADRNEVRQLMFCDLTKNTYAIHHWAQSWKYTLKERLQRRFLKIIRGVV